MSYMHLRTLLVLCILSLSLMGELFLCSGPLTKTTLHHVVNEHIKQHGSGVSRPGTQLSGWLLSPVVSLGLCLAGNGEWGLDLLFFCNL